MITLKEVRARFARDHGLPFADSLSEQSILNALNEHDIKYRDRVFTPVTTIWGFLSQVLSDDHSCSAAVSRIIAHRAASGLGTCSPNTASYCNARGRVITGVLRTLTRLRASTDSARRSWVAPIVKRCIVRYALSCPNDYAKRFVAAVKQTDPKLVASVEEMLKLFEK